MCNNFAWQLYAGGLAPREQEEVGRRQQELARQFQEVESLRDIYDSNEYADDKYLCDQCDTNDKYHCDDYVDDSDPVDINQN